MNITAGKFKGQKVTAPDETITRPTLSKVRMAVFNTLQALIDFEGASFLDMFAGSGIMGLEALSRGFEHVVANACYYTYAGVFSGKVILWFVLMALGNALGSILIHEALKLIKKLDLKNQK